MPTESKHEEPAAVTVHLSSSLLADVEAYSAKAGLTLDTFIGIASADLVRRRKEEDWYARPRHSTAEGRAEAINLLQRNTPPEPGDELPPDYDKQ